MAKKKEKGVIVLKKINIKKFQLTIVGDSPLICHKWSSKAKKEMLDKQMQEPATKKGAKDPVRDYCESLYWLDKNGEHMEVIPDNMDPSQHKFGFGFPVSGIKSAIVESVRNVDGLNMTLMRGALHIDGMMAKINGIPNMREDMVRIGQGTADLRYRGEFKKWFIAFIVKYNADVLSAEQIVNLVELSGFSVGIGEWRPQKDGTYGMYHVQR
ncbi:MAG: hypothetical protein BWY71_00101 [Planctomycetes bacterium ADurb.Bin412]|nr:MAG: hypothetical protein BWY71_00101 [Planctomycetes bacterium ADurb.Bin412]